MQKIKKKRDERAIEDLQGTKIVKQNKNSSTVLTMSAHNFHESMANTFFISSHKGEKKIKDCANICDVTAAFKKGNTETNISETSMNENVCEDILYDILHGSHKSSDDSDVSNLSCGDSSTSTAQPIIDVQSYKPSTYLDNFLYECSQQSFSHSHDTPLAKEFVGRKQLENTKDDEKMITSVIHDLI